MLAERDVLLELRRAGDPLAQPLGEHQGVVAQAEPSQRGVALGTGRGGGHRCSHPVGDRRRTSGAGRPCRPPGRRTSPSRPGCDAVIVGGRHDPDARRPPRGGCRGRARCAAPSRRPGACRLPTWVWDRPRRGAHEHLPQRPVLRLGSPARSEPCARHRRRRPRRAALLVGVGRRRLAHPGAVLVRGRAGAPIRSRVARAVALDDLEELGPVDLAEVVVPASRRSSAAPGRAASARAPRPAARSCRRTAGAGRRWCTA